MRIWRKLLRSRTIWVIHPSDMQGEQALQMCMQAHGGFEHNQHTLRIVEHIEHPYPEFRGLNLTRVVRECLAKHRTAYDQPGAHPLQGRSAADGGRAPWWIWRIGWRTGCTICRTGFTPVCSSLRSSMNWTCGRWRMRGRRADSPGGWRGHLRPTIDRVQARLVADVARNAGPSVRLSDEMEAQLAQLDRFLLENMYRSERLARADAHAKRVVAAIFAAYVAEPALMPRRYADPRGEEQGAHRVAADYLAGMTDRYCLQEHARLFGADAEG